MRFVWLLLAAPPTDGDLHTCTIWLLQPRLMLRGEQQRLQQQLAWRSFSATSKIIQKEERI